jgi:hypothetical protein
MWRLLQCSLWIAVMMTSSWAHAQWVPVVAKIRQTREVTSNGQVVEKNSKAGSYCRASNGSTLRRWTEVNGVPTRNIVGELLDNNSGTTYRVDYLEKRALVRLQSEPKTPDTYRSQQPRPSGKDVVAGVGCNVFPVTYANSGGEAGTLCISSDYALVLRTESRGTRRDGSAVRIVTELYELTPNVEPDANLFDLSRLSVEKTVPVNTK